MELSNDLKNLPASGDETKIIKEIFQYIVIKLGDENFGIDINYIDNILRMQQITRVPKVPAYLKGVINLRGEVIPVMSLRLKMGLEEEIKNDLKKLNVCYFQEGIPLISPIGATDTNIKLFLDTCFGDDEAISNNELYQTLRKLDKMIVWFVRNKDGKGVYDSSRKAVPDSKKLVRIRAIDLDDWKKMIFEGMTIGAFPSKYKKGDVKREDIILLGG